MLDELVNLLTKLFGGIFLHVHLLEYDTPIVFLQTLLILLVRNLDTTAVIPSCHGSEFDGDIVILVRVGEFSHLIYPSGGFKSIIEELDRSDISVNYVTDHIIVHQSLLSADIGRIFIFLRKEISRKFILSDTLLI